MRLEQYDSGISYLEGGEYSSVGGTEEKTAQPSFRFDSCFGWVIGLDGLVVLFQLNDSVILRRRSAKCLIAICVPVRHSFQLPWPTGL